MPFAISSPSFAGGAGIPAKYTCDGQNVSPHLRWTDPPQGTKSFVLIVDDPDAPSGTFTHCVLYDVPASQTEIAEGQASTAGRAGMNDFGKPGYGGPCPPRGHGAHRYYFRLSALDVSSLNAGAGASRKAVEQAMRGHVLQTAEFMGRYERKGR